MNEVIVWRIDGGYDSYSSKEGFSNECKNFIYNEIITQEKELTIEEKEEMILKYLAKKDGRIPKDSSLGFIKKVLHENADAITAIAKETVGFAPYKLLEEFNQTALPKE
jgi:hypothetical protein